MMMLKPSVKCSTSVVTHDAFYDPHLDGTYEVDTIEAKFVSTPSISSPFHRLLIIVFLFQIGKSQLQTGKVDG